MIDSAEPHTSTRPFEKIFSAESLTRIERSLENWGYQIELADFFSYLKYGINGRERCKFVFTKYLSASLDLIENWGSNNHISDFDLSFLRIEQLLHMVNSHPVDLSQVQNEIKLNKAQYAITEKIQLPSQIHRTHDFYYIQQEQIEANFITTKRIKGSVVHLDDTSHEMIDIKGKIVLIKSADPGYDWLFSHPIEGLITVYGGINSHMAIRAAEFGLPAVIGVGEDLFKSLQNAQKILIECENKRIEIIS